jgi:hypothetical protein
VLGEGKEAGGPLFYFRQALLRKQFIIDYGITRSVALQAGIAKGTPGIRFPSCSSEKAPHFVPLLLLGFMLSFAP